ncbi:MAG TPA: hypothetical protein VNS58_04540 [Puia sp.]|nr:hypothetical protein [Puia sp.]
MRLGRMGILLGLLFSMNTRAQDYHAIEGSPFAGSLGVANNPASILMTPYPWDITVFSLQLKTATNAVTFHNFSYLKPGGASQYSWDGGDKKRYADFNFNLHLLNVRLALSKKTGIAFGANIRGYGVARTGVANYNDSLQNMNQFFNINENTTYNINMASSSWLEAFLTYSRTLWDNETSRLNAGITLKAMRGISGAFTQLNGGSVKRSVSGAQTIYLLNAGNARYGYSSNYDRWHNGQSTTENLGSLLGKTRNGAALDLGVEYLVKTQAVTNYSNEEDAYWDYDWKIGISLLDIGRNTYVFGSQSRTASGPKSDVSDSALNAKFDHVGSLANFNDSLATIVNNISGLSGQFNVWNPTRLVINVDKPLPNNFAVNANLSLNISRPNTGKGKTFFVKEMNLLNLTPRWETKRLGVYLPIQVTTDGKFWVGGAAKAGPLLLGVHNWANVFLKDKIQNGGFYLAMIIRPGSTFEKKLGKRYDCPKY